MLGHKPAKNSKQTTRLHKSLSKSCPKSSKPRHSRKLLKSPTYSFSTTTTAPLQPDQPSTSHVQPITTMLLHLSDNSHADFRARMQTDYEIQAPSVTMRLFPLALDYTQPTIQFTIPSDDTVGKLVAEIQKQFPIRPAFVSLSTADKVYQRHYFLKELPHQSYSGQIGTVAKFKPDDFKKAFESEKTNPNASGIPPLPIQLSKLKQPVLPPPFFNNPGLARAPIVPTKAQDIISNLKERHKSHRAFNLENIKDFFGINKRAPKKTLFGQTLVDQTPTFYDPQVANMPLHPHTPLYDIIQAADLHCHVSYSEEQIAASPALTEFVKAHPDSFVEMYPTLSKKDPSYDFKTMKFALTPPKLMLERNHEQKGPVTVNLLLSLAGLYIASKVGIDWYDQTHAQQLLDQQLETLREQGVDVSGIDISQFKGPSTPIAGLSVTQHPLAEISRLQAQKQTTIGQMKLYEMELDINNSPVMAKFQAWRNGEISFSDLMPSEERRLPLGAQRAAETTQAGQIAQPVGEHLTAAAPIDTVPVPSVSTDGFETTSQPVQIQSGSNDDNNKM